MKLLKRINKGLILAVLVLVSLSIYLWSVENSHDKEKENINRACEEYYQYYQEYAMLPEAYRTVKRTIPEEVYAKYVGEAKEKLSSIMVSNKEILELQMKKVSSELEYEIEGKEVTTSLNRKILQITSYAFKEDQVVVRIRGLLEKESKSLSSTTGDAITELPNTASYSVIDTITLKKEKDGWKIVSAILDNTYRNSIRY